MLEIGRALSRLIREGKIPRPRRDIRFWWVNEFASEERLFRDFRDVCQDLRSRLAQVAVTK